MNTSLQRAQLRGRRSCVALTIGLSLGVLSGCDELLEVELPAQLTDAALEDPNGAVTLRNSIIGGFEQAFDLLVWEWYAREDAGGTVLGSSGITTDGTSYQTGVGSFFGPLSNARSFATRFHASLLDWTDAQVPNRAQHLAIASLYGGAAIGVMGSSLCEAAIDGGELMTPAQTLALADQWLTRALTEIAAVSGGDFALPFGISSSAKTTAHGLRAQVRWRAGDKTGALADAAQVPKGFTAWVTRESGPARRNKAYNDGPNVRYGTLLGVHDWWTGRPNPVTGQAWPARIPFTGYRELGIIADGRAVRDDGLPIRVAGPYLTPVESTAVPDKRVPTIQGAVQGFPTIQYIHNKYTSEAQDYPLVNWKQMFLIRAEIEGGQKAIDFVNELRAGDGLPLVTYLAPGNTEGIRRMLIEESRRALFIEGRYFFVKLMNPDLLWFPRGEGPNPVRNNGTYAGGVSLLMPGGEYILNRNLSEADRGTGCDPKIRPVLN